MSTCRVTAFEKIGKTAVYPRSILVSPTQERFPTFMTTSPRRSASILSSRRTSPSPTPGPLVALCCLHFLSLESPVEADPGEHPRREQLVNSSSSSHHFSLCHRFPNCASSRRHLHQISRTPTLRHKSSTAISRTSRTPSTRPWLHQRPRSIAFSEWQKQPLQQRRRRQQH